jgi:hypothetical protein
MLNLYTNIWTDEKGNDWELQKLVPQHLANIRSMLENIINGNRARPAGCYQSEWELKASLLLIKGEIARRKNILDATPDSWKLDPPKTAKVSKSYVVTAPAGTAARDIRELILENIPLTAKLNAAVTLVFSI